MKSVRAMAEALAGRPISGDEDYVGRLVYPRGAKGRPGKVTSTGHCRLGGCTGLALNVTWPDGARTRPCTKGCKVRKDGNLQIG